MAEFIGKVVSRTATVSVGQNATPTFDFMLEELNPSNPQYPQNCVLKVLGKKVEEISPYVKKDAVLKASFDFKGRKWNDKLFGENSCWKVENADTNATPEQPAVVAQPAVAAPTVAPTTATNTQPVQQQGNASGDDLPF